MKGKKGDHCSRARMRIQSNLEELNKPSKKEKRNSLGKGGRGRPVAFGEKAP